MSLNFKGATTVNVESINRQWSETAGWESVYRYKGPWTAIEAAAINTAYVGNASRIDVRQEPGDYGVLEVAFASIDNTTANTTSQAPDTDNWTFTPYQEQKNVWEHDYFDAIDDSRVTSGNTFKALKQRVITAVDAYKARVENANAANDSYTAPLDLNGFIDWATSSVGATEQQVAKDLAWMLLAGRETHPFHKYNLRNTRILPANTSLAVSHYKEGFQWTTNRLVDLILAQKTDVTKYAICGDLLNTFQGTYWLKEPPTINELSGGKFEIVQHFINYKSGELPYLLNPYFS